MRKSAFIDSVDITVAGGDGGNGIVSFLRERARPDGGPNGGDGGHGGNVRITADASVNTLLAYYYQRNIAAANGRHGEGKDRSGRDGDDVLMRAPVGTRITDADTGCVHADLAAAGATSLLAAGGRGGFGNAHFKSSTNRAPRRCTDGEKGERRRYHLELALLADIGLLGLPNAGKSTFLRAVSRARPKVADYPFTTLTPQLGIMALQDEDIDRAPVVADIPGLIPGAAQGAGLGNRFLKHLSRTALLCHVLDATSAAIADDAGQIIEELRQAADDGLAAKPRFLLLNKIDLLTAAQRRQCRDAAAENFPDNKGVALVSALTGEGVDDAMRQLYRCYAAMRD